MSTEPRLVDRRSEGGVMRIERSIIGRSIVALGLGLGAWSCADDIPQIPVGGSSSGDSGAVDSTGTTGGSDTGTTAVADETGTSDDTAGCDEPEICDGLDNDCDREVDEGCECAEGQQQACYSGDPARPGTGECVSGTQTCTADGQWGACEGEVLPTDEACNGLDDDCNGEADEGFTAITCGMGICQVMVDECLDGVPQTCEPGPSEDEVCNLLDDDCDGEVDEGCACVVDQVQSCYTGSPRTQGVGECADGSQTCDLLGVWGPCEGDVTPQPEQCNGLDDDCDGTSDDGDPEGGGACSTGLLGVCSAGTEHCQGGALSCTQDVMPAPEQCNGLDDDCDGALDDGNPGGGSACATGLLGVCAAGTEQCTGGAVSCQQNVSSSPEQCNGLDDDCNGTIDQGNPGGGGACVTGLPGECSAGLLACQGGALACLQSNAPSAEVCNGLDDDCDTGVDEGNPGAGGACSTGLAGVCGPGTQQCQGGALVCQQNVLSSTEACNGVDDDCDGSIDEGNPGGGGACATGNPGVCAAGLVQCQGGALVCQQTASPTPEVCNGLDDDCNGTVDQGNPGGGAACNTGLAGVCSAGTQSCVGGALQCLQNQPAAPELCDGLDNDCDGVVDDGNPGGGGACATGLPGVCGAGTLTCNGAGFDCVPNVAPSPEVCGDGLDNDCDGAVDQGCPACPPGWTSCDLDPDCETNVLDDAANCGGCGITCLDSEFCDSGACTPCAGSARDCDGSGQNGCETDIESDATNCGGCGNVCGTPAGGLCCASTCTASDPSNCGACGQSCTEGMLVIDELMNNPVLVADSAGEWFELYNPNPYDVDVRGFVISDLDTDSHMIVSVTPVIIPALGYAVLGNNDDPLANGGVPSVYQYTGIAMANGADELVVTAYGQELDRVEWISTFPPAGASRELSVNHLSSVDNDALANWCVAVDTYGLGDHGTPALPNSCSL